MITNNYSRNYCLYYQVLLLYVFSNEYRMIDEESILGACRKSNLLKTHKSINFNGHKQVTQGRTRGSFFTSMLHNLKNNFLEKEKVILKEQATRADKENLKIIAEAKYTPQKYQFSEELMPVPPSRNSSGYSKSFIIRSNLRKPASSQKQTMENNHSKFAEVLLQPKKYNFGDLKQLSQPISLIPRSSYEQLSHFEWALFIPITIMTKNPNAFSKVLYCHLMSGVELFVLTVSEQELEQARNSCVLREYCNILHCLKREDIVYLDLSMIRRSSNREKENDHKRDSEESRRVIPPNIVILERNQYPFVRIFPYLESKYVEKQKVCFAKINEFFRIKQLTICPESHNSLRVKIQSLKQPLNLQKFNLQDHLKLDIQLNQRKIKKREKRKYRYSVDSSASNYDHLQEKLIQYVKILKNEEDVSLTGGVRRQMAKTPFQVINELIRGNAHIHKQIKGFVEDSKQFQETSKIEECDEVVYHILA